MVVCFEPTYNRFQAIKIKEVDSLYKQNFAFQILKREDGLSHGKNTATV